MANGISWANEKENSVLLMHSSPFTHGAHSRPKSHFHSEGSVRPRGSGDEGDTVRREVLGIQEKALGTKLLGNEDGRLQVVSIELEHRLGSHDTSELVIVPCFAHQYSKRYVMDIIVY